MPTFAVQRGPTPLSTWDLATGTATFHPRTIRQGNVMVVEEGERLGFALDPATEGMDYKISIGDVPLSDLVPRPEDAGGAVYHGELFWPERSYFESARGRTTILLESRAEDSLTDSWEIVLTVAVYVLPSKLGEDRYQVMAEDLRKISRSLLLDLYGKSKQTYDVRFAREVKVHQSKEQELAAIEATLERLESILNVIGQRPASCVRSISCQQKYWGLESLTPAMIASMCRRGSSVRTVDRPILVPSRRRVESFDIAEHRVTRQFLDILARRAEYCEEGVRGHIRAITSERHLRNIRLGTGPTLYESFDLPRIRRLNEALTRADRAISRATNLAKLPFLRNVKPELVAVKGGHFSEVLNTDIS